VIARAAFLAGVSLALLPRTAFAQASHVRMAGVFSDLFAEPFYAQAAGAFGRAGMTVEATSLNNAGAVAAALSGGAMELGVGDLVSGVNAIVKGVPILLVAGGGLYRESQQETGILAVVKDSPLRAARDLAGKSIGVPTLVGLTTACVRAWLAANGVAVESVKLVEIPQAAVVPALQRGTLDVGLLAEPFVTQNRDVVRSVGYPNNVIADRTPNKEFPVSVWYAAKSWVDEDRARAHRALDAIYETARWANAHHDETFAILVRDGQLDASKLQGLPRVPYATALTPAMVQPILDVALQGKIFSQPLDAASLISKL
jgi:NitT/TauT family transport system substrate-binding protein